MASSVRELWDYRALVANMARRQLKSEHKRDFLGAAWSLLNPLLNLAILSLVFGTILSFGAASTRAGVLISPRRGLRSSLAMGMTSDSSCSKRTGP